MRTDGRTAWRRITGAVALAMAGALLAVGCGAPGQLHDGGRTRPVAVRPTPQPLWPAAKVAATPTPRARAGLSAPSPIPGITVASADIRTVSVTKLLAGDPALERDERAVLPTCPKCDLLPPQYRDLTGDGRPELITALVTPGDRAVLHVYTLKGTQIVPILNLPVSPGFTADTVGRDLVVQEPTTASIETSSRYQWDGSRLAFAARQIKATGPGSAVDALACIPGVANGTGADAEPSAVPSPAPVRMPPPTAAPELHPASPVQRGRAAQPVPSAAPGRDGGVAR
ncbi:hypothetical protein [Peterkaempfera bronchialis]|uniref:hypothetical protein n=1 Tax=Peterkaempfera bronchialis TaxID=2126346 RepID=UPI003C2D7F07